MSKAKKEIDVVAILNKYVSKDAQRPNLHQPWTDVDAKRSLATDGHILVSFPRHKDIPTHAALYKTHKVNPPAFAVFTAFAKLKQPDTFCWLPVDKNSLDKRKVVATSTWCRDYKTVHQLWAGRAIQFKYAQLILRTLQNVFVLCEFDQGKFAKHFEKPLVFKADDDALGLIMPVRLFNREKLEQLGCKQYPKHIHQEAAITAMAGGMQTNVQPIWDGARKSCKKKETKSKVISISIKTRLQMRKHAKVPNK